LKKMVFLQLQKIADVAELVDALDLGSSALGRGGSSPFIRTKIYLTAMPQDTYPWFKRSF
jgi:hypothetical protein